MIKIRVEEIFFPEIIFHYGTMIGYEVEYKTLVVFGFSVISWWGK